MKVTGRIFLSFIMLQCSFALCCLPAFAGNKEMVEKRVQELDTLNKQVVQTIPELPKDGEIFLKARVRQTGAQQIEIMEKSATVKEETIQFNAGQTAQTGEQK